MIYQKPWTIRMLSLGIIIFLLVGCGGPKATTRSSTPAPSPNSRQSVKADIEKAVNNLQSDKTVGVDQAEQAVMGFLREQGGAKAVLGDRASLLFQQMDTAETEMVAKIIAQIEGLSDQPGQVGLARSLPLLRTLNLEEAPAYEWKNPDQSMEVVALLLIVLELFAGSKGAEYLQGEMPPIESTETTKDNVTAHIVMRLSFKGPKMEASIDLTRNHPGPPAYQESTSGKVTLDICPDADGNVPANFDLKSSSTIAGGGAQWSTAVQVVGHVNDEGRLASYDIESQSTTAQQNSASNDNKYVELTLGYTMGLGEGGEWVGSNVHAENPRNSAQVTPEFLKSANDSFILMISYVTPTVLHSAEAQWTNGYCVKILVPDLDNRQQAVEPDSETPFKATVRHKFENTDLTVPVTANMADGKVSVEPSGSKVLPPAAFTYTAPAEFGAKATVHLETRSKRGIGRLDLTFLTQAAAYELEFDSIFVTRTTLPGGMSGPINVTQHVHTLVPLNWSQEGHLFRGEAPLEYVLFDVPPIFGIGGDSGIIDWCPNKTSASGETFQVLMLEGLNSATPASEGKALALELTIDPGKTTETTVPVCPPPFNSAMPVNFSFPLLTWTEEFASTHYMESPAKNGEYIIKDWTAGEGAVVAIKTYTLNNSAAEILTVNEITTLTLRKK